MKIIHPSLVLAPAVLCAAVLMSGGCSSNATVEAKSATVGQALQDLDAAYSKGLLTEDEYKKQRKAILDRK